MIDLNTIVETAMVSFNNSALYMPYFFLVSVLSLPLFYILYQNPNILGKYFKINTFNISLITEISLFLWLICMSGNFQTIRDFSYINYFIAVLLFLLTYIVYSKLSKIYVKNVKNYIKHLCFICLITLITLIQYDSLINVLLNISAFISGLVVSSYYPIKYKSDIKIISIDSFILFCISSLIFIQPEFFRFGWLGNLTILHLSIYLLLYFCFGIALAFFITKPQKKLGDNIVKKIKILFRLVFLILSVLFLLTESFLVLLVFLFVSFLLGLLNLYNNYKNNKFLYIIWGFISLIVSIITMLPFISCISLISIKQSNMDKKNIKSLL